MTRDELRDKVVEAINATVRRDLELSLNDLSNIQEAVDLVFDEEVERQDGDIDVDSDEDDF